jgi:hypothetical protein
MTVMEILNREEIRPFMEQVPQITRTFPSAMMMYISLKCLIFLVINMLIMICLFPCVWDSLNDNKRRKMEEDRKCILSSQSINEE